MLFASLQDRLLSHLRERVRAGELTERGLAKLTGISQPHLNNVLKGVRALSPAYADQILTNLDLTLFDLINPSDSGRFSTDSTRNITSDVPWLRGIVGPRHTLEPVPFPGDVYPIPRLITERLADPVLVTLGYDPVLLPHFQSGDLALIARPSITPKTLLDSSAVYLVRTAEGTLLRSLRIGGARLYLITPETIDEPRKWGHVPLSGGQQLAEVVIGNLVWIQRTLGDDPFRPTVTKV